jgi:cysteinyl-tRNA synthetase
MDNRTATVDSKGTVTGIAVGVTHVIAETEGIRPAEVTVEVLPSAPMPTAVPETATPRRGANPDAGITNVVVQLQNYQRGGLDSLALGRYQLAVIDLARDAGDSYFTADEISRLKGSGKKVLAYFEIGSIENFRPDFSPFKNNNPDLMLNEWPTWPGEYFVKYWDPRWWDLAIKPRVDQALAAGFDGVYMDTPIAYEEIDLSLVPGEQRESLGSKMADLIVRISAYAKTVKPQFWILPQNSPELQRYPGYVHAVDGIGIEELFFLATDQPCEEPYCAANLEAVRALRRAGKIVVAIDYASKPENITNACRRYREENFTGYVTTRSLDTISPPCP